MMTDIVDAAQRARALDYRTSFAVTAPAGSGKTELLIQRCLTLLARVEKPEEILAITFTRKAANEMRSRILAALVDGQSDEPPTEAHKLNTWTLARAVLSQDQQFDWQLLDNPNRLRIQTIDSFCMHLVQRMPLLSRLGAEARVSDDSQAQYQQAARRLLARLEESSPISDDLQRLLAHLDNNTARIETLLCSILSKREQWLRHFISAKHGDFDFRAYLESCLTERVQDALHDCTESLMMFESELMQSVDFACTQLQELAPDAELLACAGLTELPETEPDALPQWRAITSLLLTKDGRFRATLTKNQGFPASSKKDEKAFFKAAKADCLELIGEFAHSPGLLAQLQEISHLPVPRYTDQQWQLLDTLTRLLPTLVAELTLVFMEQGQLDYAQISSAAATALGDDEQPSDIALLLDYQLKHILVDEFQDTSTPQFNLLKRLTDGWEPDDGRTLFIVGDGMQSCYGFREANVGLFLAAREFGIGNAELEPLDLQANFRSDAGVVNWVNSSFSKAFPAQDNIARGAVAYSPSVAVHSETQSTPVQFFACVEEDGRQSEAAKVIELVQQISVSQPDDSIAILVRNRSHLRDIMPALRNAQIDWRAVDIDPLSKRPLISDLMALTQALLNPSDRIAWLSVLRAPWCGLTLADLHSLAGSKTDAERFKPTIWAQLNKETAINTLSDTGIIACNRLLSILKPSIRQRQRKPLRQWLEGVWLALGGPLTASSSQELAQAPAFFELLCKHEVGGDIPDFTAFREAASRLFAKPESNPDIRLQIMTIHKSKGLEFDHVILPGLDRGNASRNQELLLWHERLSTHGEPLLLMGSLPEKGGTTDPLYDYLKREHRLKEQLENTRLLYVGATRAVKQLCLLANVTRRDEGSDDMKPPSENSLLHSLWPQIKDQAIIIDTTLPRDTRANDTNTPKSAATILRLATNWQTPNFPRNELLAAYRGHEYHGNEMLELDSLALQQHAQEEQRDQLASCFRCLLFAICQRGSDYWKNVGSSSLQILVNNQLQQSNFHVDASLGLHLLGKLQQVLNDETGQWLLSNSHQQARTNWQLNEAQRVDENSEILQHRIARSFVENNQHWLIEFDTQSAANNEPLISQQRAQLMSAAGALSQLSSVPVKAAIYFACSETPRLIEL